MAPSAQDDEPKFRFIVKIMPPRRPANSLFKRLQQPKVEEPLHVIAVPARASETFADVWKHIKERYERNYTAEEVGKGWFHKLQDRFGADIDSHDGVGELGYTTNSPREDLVLVMLQNEIDRDGSVPDTSGLRPPGFSRPELSAEQEQQAKRRKIQEERYGAALEDVDEDMPIESRERSLGSDSPGAGARGHGDDAHRIDADGFAVPQLPGSLSRKRKRSRVPPSNIIQSSMEGENEEDILVQDSQTAIESESVNPDALPIESQAPRGRIMRSVPADAGAGASTASARSNRAMTAAPAHRGEDDDEEPLQAQRLAALQAVSSKPKVSMKDAKSQPRSPPTPVSATSQPVTQQPPESAQRPKPTPPVGFTAVNQKRQYQPPISRETPEDSFEFDPIEDDDLLQGIAGTANDGHEVSENDPGVQIRAPASSASKVAPSQPGKLARPHKTIGSTPKANVPASRTHKDTPASNALKRLSGSQGSSQKNPRARPGFKELWTPEEDNYLLLGLREGLNAAETSKKYNMEGRTPSAVRGRRALLIKQNPEIESSAMDSAGDNDKSASSATKRKLWSVAEKQIISRAIAKGFDAHEINTKHFPTRSADSMVRIVLSLQDQAWKVAAMDSMFPKNGAQLQGWTPKDSCKLRRTYEEGLPTRVAKKTYFGRWSMEDVQRQLDAYSAQIKALQADQARASQAGSAIKKAVFGSSQLPLDSSQVLVNSSPVERSIQARAARRLSVDGTRLHMTTDVPSSPPQASAAKLSSTQVQNGPHTADQKQRLSSPTVDITANEQDNARERLIKNESVIKPVSCPSSGGSRQTKLNFFRDKGKSRADGPRPSSQELDAQYSRRSISTNVDRSATQLQERPGDEVSHDSNLIELDESDDDDQHTPADDLEMLEAEFDGENGPLRQEHVSNNVSRREPVSISRQPFDENTRDQETLADSEAADQPSLAEVRRPSASTAMTMQSPMTTSSSSSVLRRRSRVEFGVDTRAAEQLSQELNRSLSREAREEAAHEDQVFHTPDPKLNRYRRTTKPGTVTFSDDIAMQDDNGITNDSQAFQTQAPASTKSQRASRVPMQSQRSPRSTDHDLDRTQKRPALQPSPQIGVSGSVSPHAVTSETTPAKPGKLPSRGQSYASRIKDIHRPAHLVSSPAGKVSGGSSQQKLREDLKKPVSDARSPSPTDAEIRAETWEKSAAAGSIGRDRQEYLQELEISASSIDALGRGDWEEVKRLRAEENRMHRQQKIARGTYVPSERDAQHPDGPAQGGDVEDADEDVIRADDNSAISSDVEEEEDDDKVWSDLDVEQPPEVEHDRHFSEVEDDEALEDVKNEAPEETTTLQKDNRTRHAFQANDNDETTATVLGARQEPQADGTDAAEPIEEHEDELELPTIHTLPDTDCDIRHAITDDDLQELNNSGAEGSPIRLSHSKRKGNEDRGDSELRHKKQQPDDRAAMPPPLSIDAKVSKRQKRRRRRSDQHVSKSGSERSSSFSHQHPSSDAPQQHAPFTPIRYGLSGHPSMRPKIDEMTPAKHTSQAPLLKTQTPRAGSQKAPASSSRGNQRSNGGGMSGLSGLVHKAHIPTPPKIKQPPEKENRSRKFDINADDDESDESIDSD